MKYIKREKSVITGKDNLEHLHTFDRFPVYMGCVDETDTKKDLFADMSFSICRESGIIQLDKVLPPEIVYSHEHNDGVGKIWQDHYVEFSKFIHKFHPMNVLEIGGGNGLVAKLCTDVEKKLSWTIVEPNPLIKNSSTVSVIKGWYGTNFEKVSNVDTIVHSHVLEHTYDPRSFLEKINSDLHIGNKHIFSIPDLYILLKKKHTNSLNFEHTIFLSEFFVDYLLLNSGFRILEKKRYLNHSIFYATEKSKKQNIPKLETKYSEYRDLFNDFISTHDMLTKRLNQNISDLNCDIYLFGAHIFSQFLIKSGLDTRKICGILDNSDLKNGKRLYGTDLIVFKPSILKGLGKVAVILRAGEYQSEIRSQIISLNSKTIVIE